MRGSSGCSVARHNEVGTKFLLDHITMSHFLRKNFFTSHYSEPFIAIMLTINYLHSKHAVHDQVFVRRNCAKPAHLLLTCFPKTSHLLPTCFPLASQKMRTCLIGRQAYLIGKRTCFAPTECLGIYYLPPGALCLKKNDMLNQALRH